MSKNPIIQAIENEQLKADVADFSPGDTVVVQVKVKEGNRERLQAATAVSTLHLPCVRFLTVWALSVLSRLTLPRLRAYS
jgi:hypothetical protein